MRAKEDIWSNQCDKCGEIAKEGELWHSEEFGGAICGKCEKDGEKENNET